VNIVVERILFTTVLFAIGFGAFLWFQYQQKARISHLNDDGDVILNRLSKGKPAVVYFSTPTCIPCKTQQRPALDRLESQLGDVVQIIEIDATEYPEIAEKWGVFSSPTTIILDRHGKTQHINYGATPADKLVQQIGLSTQ
jgi:thiol-disulfide isomerase/thioredoxin